MKLSARGWTDCVVNVEEKLARSWIGLCAQSAPCLFPGLSPALTDTSENALVSGAASPLWDLFCPIVDNFGDIGVCWRLARQLVREHGIGVRLWVDDLVTARWLIPSLDPTRPAQSIEGVDIRAWTEDFPPTEPGMVVISAFASALPGSFLEAMARSRARPAWINLEYLSGEDWVGSCHGLPSPHPRLPLSQHFFFPGMDAASGGLIREADYPARRASFSARAFWTTLGLNVPQPCELRVSLFSYENPGLSELLAVWSRSACPVVCLVPEGRVLSTLAAEFGVSGLRPGDQLIREALTLKVLPFVEQDRYDEILWACDLNFVRGEDSFVRAQWAEKPCVWHLYAQDEGAHLAKLQAFLDRHQVGLEPTAAKAMADFGRAWNLGRDVAEAWPAFLAALPALGAHARVWSRRLQENGDLAGNLVRFCKRLEVE